MANKKKFSFFGGKEEKKGIQYEVRDQVNPDPVEAKRIEKLNKEIEKNLRPVNDHEKIDLVTGQIYKDDHTDQKPRIKEKGQMWSPSFFKKEISAKPIAKPIIRKNKISSKLLIVCIEITYPMEKLEKLLKAVFIEKETFIKFIFFANGIYKTDLLFFSKISEEEILKLIKAQKDLTSEEEIFKTLKEDYLKTLRNKFKEQGEDELLSEKQIWQKVKEIKSELNSDNVLLYDAIDEALQISKEDVLFPKRRYLIENDEYIIEENKYIFIFSGEEKGSLLKKIEIQSIIKDLRAKEANLNVILTNPKNLVDISTLGFRWIRTINI